MIVLSRPHRCLAWLLLALGTLCVLSGPARADDDGFESIFDGKTFAGWKAPDMTYWSVEEAAITARITKEHPCTVNQYLVWQGGALDDFDIKLSFRIESKEDVNGGFQFRSKVLPDNDVAGYQVDNDTRGGWLVRLYDEHGRETLAFRGQRAEIAEDGKITHSEITDAKGPARFRLDQWHEYHLVCRGQKLSLSVNGQLVAEVNDGDPKQRDLSGILALQLHSGPPMSVQFKDIRLKRLKAAVK